MYLQILRKYKDTYHHYPNQKERIDAEKTYDGKFVDIEISVLGLEKRTREPENRNDQFSTMRNVSPCLLTQYLPPPPPPPAAVF